MTDHRRMLLVVLGVIAGVLTTVAGLGGGIALVLALSLLWGAPTALAVTAPALLFGNVHRTFLYREHIDRGVALRFALGAIPASMFGGMMAAHVPPWSLQVTMLVTTGYAIARALGWVRWTPPAAALVPAGAVVGAVAATAGVGAVLAAPVLMAAGLAGERYLATVALASVSLHAGRIAGYGVAGLIDTSTLSRSALLAAAILAGNLIGQRVRKGVSPRAGRALEVATLGVCTLMAVAGL